MQNKSHVDHSLPVSMLLSMCMIYAQEQWKKMIIRYNLSWRIYRALKCNWFSKYHFVFSLATFYDLKSLILSIFFLFSLLVFLFDISFHIQLTLIILGIALLLHALTVLGRSTFDDVSIWVKNYCRKTWQKGETEGKLVLCPNWKTP